MKNLPSLLNGMKSFFRDVGCAFMAIGRTIRMIQSNWDWHTRLNTSEEQNKPFIINCKKIEVAARRLLLWIAGEREMHLYMREC